MGYHPLLERQLRKTLGEGTPVPPDWQHFLTLVDQAYREVEEDRCMLERAMELSSQELLQSNSELRAVMQAFPDIFIRFKKDGSILDCKGGTAAQFHMEPERLVGKRIQDAPGTAGRQFQDAMRNLTRDQGTAQVEYSFETGGRVHWYEARLVPYLADQIVTIIRNITDRKLAEEAMRVERDRAERAAREKMHVISSVNAFFIAIDDKGVVTEWTGSAELLFGISLESAHGQPFRLLPIDWDWNPIDEAMRQTVDSEKHHVLENFKLVAPGRRDVYLKLTVVPMRADDGSGDNLVLMGEDVTARLLMERDLAQAQKLESIGQLAAGIAHEINTPTQFVGDNARFLQDSFTQLRDVVGRYRELLAAFHSGGVSDETIRSVKEAEKRADLEFVLDEVPNALAQSIEGIERIARIVRAMKEFAHPDAGGKTEVDLHKAIESTITVARNEWKYVADMVTDFDPALPPVPCLPGEINQVILNLIVNAAHAVAEVVGQGSRPKGTITVSTRRAGEWAEIRIRDTGTGIPEGIRERIFDPFFTTKEVGKGTGQGLSMARTVVTEKHGGTITFETVVGNGTTFIIRLPLKAPARTVAQGLTHDAASPAR